MAMLVGGRSPMIEMSAVVLIGAPDNCANSANLIIMNFEILRKLVYK